MSGQRARLCFRQIVPRPCAHERRGEPRHPTYRALLACLEENGDPGVRVVSTRLA